MLVDVRGPVDEGVVDGGAEVENSGVRCDTEVDQGCEIKIEDHCDVVADEERKGNECEVTEDIGICSSRREALDTVGDGDSIKDRAWRKTHDACIAKYVQGLE